MENVAYNFIILPFKLKYKFLLNSSGTHLEISERSFFFYKYKEID